MAVLLGSTAFDSFSQSKDSGISSTATARLCHLSASPVAARRFGPLGLLVFVIVVG